MQALAPHRNVCHSHLSFKKYADIANYYIPLSQYINNHHKDKGLAEM